MRAIVLYCRDCVTGLPQLSDMDPRAAIDRNLLVTGSVGKEDLRRARLKVNG